MNIKFYYTLTGLTVTVIGLALEAFYPRAFAVEPLTEPVRACVLVKDRDLTDALRARYAQCLGWQEDRSSTLCRGYYREARIEPLSNAEEIRILAEKASFYRTERSLLQGNVEIQQGARVVNAETAYVYRDPKTNEVNRIELLGNVRYTEPDKLMLANKAIIFPKDKSGIVEDALYRFNLNRHGAILPAWGRASLVERFPNQNYLLRKATYSNCAPQDKAWEIQADKITLDHASATGVARNAVLRLYDWPVLYTPYINFPTNRDRKSGFLMPVTGYSNIGGYDLALPYYWNMAPNYDSTFIPHWYTRRGVMMGGQFRFLTPSSAGVLEGNFLPNDRAYNQFLNDNTLLFPDYARASRNRWSAGFHETTAFSPNLQSNINFQQVSDDYFLQDFSTNLAVLTERQLLRQVDMKYSGDHWILSALAQSYQTLNPINETPVFPTYERLPQIYASALYNELPFNANFTFLGQYDQFHWPNELINMQHGPRFHLNPVLSLPQVQPWGFITPAVQLVENYYQVDQPLHLPDRTFNRTIPRYSVDGGLYFERELSLFGKGFTQTLEPRLFYLNVPFRNQTAIPVYDSGYMIFNTNQLFRTNRFSGFDRIGDANQLAYAVSSRWLSEDSGEEKASVSVGQIRYFSNRRVQLCQSLLGECVDNPNSIGFLSLFADYSPIASHGVYHFNSSWSVIGDYVWDPATRATNNGQLNFHYQPAMNHILNFGYTYLVNGDFTRPASNPFPNPLQTNALHQATISYAWPLNDHWSTLGAYSYNISKGYNMMGFFGLQYDSCCWAMRLVGGRTFKSLDQNAFPQYNNNVYLQILLKGLGSVANSDPYSTITTYIPSYNDQFHR